MKLSNRLWHAIACRLKYREPEEELRVWVKVKSQVSGKRHAFTDIELRPDEEAAVKTLLAECDDEYFRATLAHERETNPDMVTA